MNNKATKSSYTSSITTRQQSTFSQSHQTTISSSTNPNSVSSYRSPYRTNAGNSSSTSIATRSSSQYRSVYNRTTNGTSSGDFTRNSPTYSSLQNSTPPFARNAIAATGQRLHSPFGSRNNDNQLMTSSSYTRPQSVLPSYGGVMGPAGSAVSKDARAFGSSTGSVSSSSSASAALELYDLTPGKGYVVIFHHKYFKNDKASIREGSEKDLKLLKEFFAKYRVEKPIVCEDYTVAKVKNKMTEISRKKFNSYSCLIIIVMSHGETKDRIKAYDALYNFETEVVERVLQNETLKDKPKLFFIQACKGNALMETDVISTATNKNDMIKCYSTYEGTLSFRDKITGTYFIQILFHLIEEHGDKDLSEIMIILRRKFAADKLQQAPTDTSTMTKKFFFRNLRKSK